MKKIYSLVFLLCAGISLAQEWYDNTWADPEEERKNIHSGNLVQSTFRNTGLVGRIPGLGEFSFEWPRGTGDEYIGDISVVVGVEYYNPFLRRAVRSVAVTKSPARGRDEVNPADPSEYWTFLPMPGFASPDTNLVAMSHMRETWPDVWPDKSWPGSWNGYFGRDVNNADQESYFWMDDSRDREFLLDQEWAFRDSVDQELWLSRFPADPESALVSLIQPFEDDVDHAGLGLKVSCRGFQWSHVLAEDVVFWLYDITNTSDINYDKVSFGMVCGTLVGGDGDSGDDLNYFDLDKEFTYTSDGDDRGVSGWVPVHPGVRNVGLVGYAFLESPGNNIDWIDNDGDSQAGELVPRLDSATLSGMLDTLVISQGEYVVAIDYDTPGYPRSIVEVPAPGDTLVLSWRNLEIPIYDGAVIAEDPTNLIDDNFNGLIDENEAYINSAYFDWREIIDEGSITETPVLISQEMLLAYDPLIDEKRFDGVDNDGDWDPEFDDVGADGQPGTGDTGEDNGVPDSGEPHFDELDVSESDQIGLTSFDEFTFSEYSSRNDEDIWNKMVPGEFDSTSTTPSDIDFLYGAGYFPLRAGETQRISLAVVFGESTQDLFNNLATVRMIYDENYNFIKPPAKPHVDYEVSDGEVTLYWDDRAEFTVDRISHLRDFEGYRIYRATDPGFLDAYTITDAMGNSAGFSPIAQFDLINEVEGFFDLPLNGTQYYMGSNTGLQHSWTDTTAVNGQSYFYAVTAYDRGDPYAGFLPAETSKQASMNGNGDVTLDVNTIYVIPSAPSSGYMQGLVMEEANHISGRATGSVGLRIINEQALVSDGEYTLTIEADTIGRAADIIEWQAIAWTPDTVFVWDEGDSIFVAEIDSIAYDSTLTQSGELMVPAFAWSLERDNLEPAVETIPINEDTPRQHLSHNGIKEDAFSATFLDLGMNNTPSEVELLIHTRLDTGELLNVNGHFDFDYDDGLVIYRDEFLETLEDQLNEVRFEYEYRLVHKQLFMDLTGYSNLYQNYLRVVEGVELDFRNHWSLRVDADQSGWNEQTAENVLPWSISVLSLGSDFSSLTGVPTAHDFEIEFLEDASGASSGSRIEFPSAAFRYRIVDSLQTSFRVMDITDPANRFPVDFWIYNSQVNTRDPLVGFDPLDVIILYEKDEPENPDSDKHLTWMLQSTIIFNPETMSMPNGGDIYTAITQKPFTNNDVWQYEVQPPTESESLASAGLDDIRVVPNPYLASASWERKAVRGNRGERKIQFIHLPSKATIRIYTIAGELVRTLYHDEVVWDGSLDWNLKSKEGLDVAFGVYLYHVDSPAGETTGKFALIK
jgi:hypothetical protein